MSWDIDWNRSQGRPGSFDMSDRAPGWCLDEGGLEVQVVADAVRLQPAALSLSIQTPKGESSVDSHCLPSSIAVSAM